MRRREIYGPLLPYNMFFRTLISDIAKCLLNMTKAGERFEISRWRLHVASMPPRLDRPELYGGRTGERRGHRHLRRT